MTQKQHVIHGRDHEHTGPDPIQIHWEDVGGGGSGGGGGIQFDTYPQAGEWLYVETDGPGESPSGYGMELFDQGGLGVNIASAGGNVDIHSSGGGYTYLRSANRVYVLDQDTVDGGGITIQSDHSQIQIASLLGIHITSSTSDIYLDNQSGAGVIGLSSGDGGIHLDAASGGGDVQVSGQQVFVNAYGASISKIDISAQGTGTFDQMMRYRIFGYPESELGGKQGHFFSLSSGSTVGTRVEFYDHTIAQSIMRIDVSPLGVPTYHIKSGASWAADL